MDNLAILCVALAIIVIVLAVAYVMATYYNQPFNATGYGVWSAPSRKECFGKTAITRECTPNPLNGRGCIANGKQVYGTHLSEGGPCENLPNVKWEVEDGPCISATSCSYGSPSNGGSVTSKYTCVKNVAVIGSPTPSGKFCIRSVLGDSPSGTTVAYSLGESYTEVTTCTPKVPVCGTWVGVISTNAQVGTTPLTEVSGEFSTNILFGGSVTYREDCTITNTTAGTGYYYTQMGCLTSYDVTIPTATEEPLPQCAPALGTVPCSEVPGETLAIACPTSLNNPLYVAPCTNILMEATAEDVININREYLFEALGSIYK